MAQEQRKNLNPVGVKKRLKDYEKMLQYYTLMKMKKKMKDFEKINEEWWEVVEEYFTKELEKKLAQHKANEIIMKHKLETYQKNFPDFIYNSLINIKISSQDEGTKVGPSGITQEKEMHIKEPQDFKSGIVQEEDINRKTIGPYRRTFKYLFNNLPGVKKRKNHKKFKNNNRWRLFQQQKKWYLRYNPWK